MTTRNHNELKGATMTDPKPTSNQQQESSMVSSKLVNGIKENKNGNC